MQFFLGGLAMLLVAYLVNRRLAAQAPYDQS